MAELIAEKRGVTVLSLIHDWIDSEYLQLASKNKAVKKAFEEWLESLNER